MSKTREGQALLYACTQEGCPICRLTHDSTTRYLTSWKDELFTDIALRDELRRTQGFCHAHTQQLVQMGATLPLAQTYQAILSDTIEQLQPKHAYTNVTKRFYPGQRDWRQERLKKVNCPACLQQDRAAERSISTFRELLLDPAFYQTFAASQGLCLPHFKMASTLPSTKKSAAWLPLLEKAQLVCLRRINQQLSEMIRKHDYRFKDEEQGPEMLAWKRAASLVAGEE